MTASARDLVSAELKADWAVGLRLRMGPFNICLTTTDPDLAMLLSTSYPAYPVAPANAFVHAGVSAGRAQTLLPRRGRGAVHLDDGTLFTDYDAGQALPYVEWAVNWCVATRCHFLLMLHAAVVEKQGYAMIMPGLPGAGKSTLCAYLVHHGWRLLSDEFCLLRPRTTEIIPFPRLIPLKNESIDVVAEQVSTVRLGPRYVGTRKGTVAHVIPSDAHVQNTATATAALIVKPEYKAGQALSITKQSPPQCFLELSRNSFNYQMLGHAGFETVADLVDTTSGFHLRYSELSSAAACLDELMAEHISKL